jgi:competence protein ComEA
MKHEEEGSRRAPNFEPAPEGGTFGVWEALQALLRRVVPPARGSGLKICAILVLLAGCTQAAEPLQTFEGCSFVAEPWADGDSFPVRFPDGEVRTVRLYGVDCLESQVEGDEANARRLREQKRWFGIRNIQEALRLGREAKAETQRLLEQPFTVSTSFADARGDSRFSRIYGFVKTDSGLDLSEYLVVKGLARAFGVVRERPDGTKGSNWRDRLGDLELRAAKAGNGAWGLTDWDSLLAERQAMREEMAEIESVRKVDVDPGLLALDPNRASRDELMRIPGVGEVMALRIIENRPYRKLSDLNEVPGIGEKTLDKLAPYFRFP